MDSIEQFYELARSHVTEVAELAYERAQIESGLPGVLLDLNTGQAYKTGSQDDDDRDVEDILQDLKQFNDDDFEDRLRDACDLIESIVYGTSEDMCRDSSEAVDQLEWLSAKYRPVPIQFDDAIKALSEISVAIAGEDRFSVPSVVVPEVFIELNDKLLRALATNPELIRAVDSRLFEQVIAEIFRKFQMRVELTKRTRDGGVDILAFEDTRYTKNRYIIECKHY